MMMMCVRVVGLRVPPSCCASPWPPHRFSLLDSLLRTCYLPHSIPIGSPSPPSQNKRYAAACGADLKNKNSRSGGVQSVSFPPVDGQSPSSFVVEPSLLAAQFPPRKPRLRRSVARGGPKYTNLKSVYVAGCIVCELHLPPAFCLQAHTLCFRLGGREPKRRARSHDHRHHPHPRQPF